MSIFEVDCKLITLSGVILSSHLTLHNPHQMLAVIFELQARPPFLQIEPMRGMIMQGERKIIKLRCKTEARPSLGKIERRESMLVVRGSYCSEYNKKVMAKNSLKGWTAVSKEFQETLLPIYFNLAGEIEKVREEANRSGSINSRRMNSFEKFRESSIKRVKNEKLNEDLDFIFRNEQFKRTYESKYSAKQQSPRVLKTSTAPQLLQDFPKARNAYEEILSPIKSTIVQQASEPPAIRQVLTSKKAASPVSQPIRISGQKGKERRGVDLIILAIIAALFLGLGEGVGHTFKH